MIKSYFMKKMLMTALITGILFLPNHLSAQKKSGKTEPAAVINGRNTANAQMDSQFGIALKLTKQFNLTDNQVNDLLDKAIVLKEKMAFSKANPDSGYFNRGLFENEHINRILTEEQYTRVLYEKHKSDASARAEREWEILNKEGAAVKYNKEAVLQDLTDYYVRLYSIHDRYWYKDRALAATATRKLAETTPEVVVTLALLKDPYAWADMNSQFGLAAKHEKQLGLTVDQVEQLLARAREIKKKKDFSKAHPDSGYFDTHKFESIHLPAILTDNQYARLLFIKNKPAAERQALYDWHALNEKGLAAAYNKDSTVQKLTDYYVATYNAKDRYAHDKEKRNETFKKINANKMPEALSALKRARNGEEQKLSAGQYRW